MRADSDREAPVTDGEIRAYLAERWSRSRPKEAALDYMDGAWEERDVRERRRSAARAGQGEADDGAAETRAAANDNALTRIARDVQRTAFAWRHGAAVDAFAAGRQEVMAGWDELRQKTRADGDAVALGDVYRETLDRHAALLRQAEPFRARPQAFTALLTERGGIGRGDLDDFEALHDRARRHRRAATMRQVHRTRQESQGQDLVPETRQGELAVEADRAETPAEAETVARQHTPPPRPAPGEPPAGVPIDDEGYYRMLAAEAKEAREEALSHAREGRSRPARKAAAPSPPDWWPAYEAVAREWNALIERARQAGTLSFYDKGYAGLIPRIRALAENPDIPARRRAPMIRALENHERHVATRKSVENVLDAAGRQMDGRDALHDAAADAGVPLTGAPGYAEWRRTADRLMKEARAILAGRETFGPHLDNIAIGTERAEWAVSDLGGAIRQDDEELAEAERKAREQHRRAGQWDDLRFAPDTAPEIAAALARPAPEDDDTRARRALWRLRRVYDWDGRLAERDRQAGIEAGTQASLERWRVLREAWNGLVDHAEKANRHVIYADGYTALREGLASLAREDPNLPARFRSGIDRVLGLLADPEASRRHVEEHRERLLSRLEHRDEMLEIVSAWDEQPAPDRPRYDAWREGTDEAVAEAECVLADRRGYGIHVDGLEYRRQGLDAALSDMRKVLREDDRHIAETLAGKRKGEDERMREERIARLLGDPEKLKELRQRRAERRAAREAGRRQRKGRHMSMRL